MEAAMFQPKAKIHQLCALTPKIGEFLRPNILSFPAQINNQRSKKGVMKCAPGEMKLVVEKDEELDIEEELKKLNEKCRGIGGGIVELMECLEREAIMGEDEGREATDYNRRALIFDRSSRVFQALKQRSQTDAAGGTSSAAAAPCV